MKRSTWALFKLDYSDHCSRGFCVSKLRLWTTCLACAPMYLKNGFQRIIIFTALEWIKSSIYKNCGYCKSKIRSCEAYPHAFKGRWISGQTGSRVKQTKKDWSLHVAGGKLHNSHASTRCDVFLKSTSVSIQSLRRRMLTWWYVFCFWSICKVRLALTLH